MQKQSQLLGRNSNSQGQRESVQGNGKERRAADWVQGGDNDHMDKRMGMR